MPRVSNGVSTVRIQKSNSTFFEPEGIKEIDSDFYDYIGEIGASFDESGMDLDEICLLTEKEKRRFDSRFSVTDQQLGSGSFGKVYLGADKSGGGKVAIKKIKKRKIYDSTVNERGKVVPMEIEILIKIKGLDGFVQMIDFFEMGDEFWLVTEFFENAFDLNSFIMCQPGPSEKEALFIFRKICICVQRLFNCKIIHRDIKPENIIITSEATIKLIDFGSATYIDRALKNLVATTLYLPPEFLREEIYKPEAVAVWSLGLVLAGLLTGKDIFAKLESPYAVSYKETLEALVIKSVRSFIKNITPTISIQVKDLLSKCLNEDPDERITLRDILKHKCFNGLN
jgi:serine/threonine protein kinase